MAAKILTALGRGMRCVYSGFLTGGWRTRSGFFPEDYHLVSSWGPPWLSLSLPWSVSAVVRHHCITSCQDALPLGKVVPGSWKSKRGDLCATSTFVFLLLCLLLLPGERLHFQRPLRGLLPFGMAATP